jgi:hypothetical protein
VSDHPNAELIRAFHRVQHAFYGGGPAEPVRALLADDVAWRVPGRNAIAGDYRGVDEVMGYFERRRDHAHSTLRITVHDVLANDDRVVILAGGTIERDGRKLGWETVGLFRIEEGRIAEGRLVPFDQEAFDEVWA